MKELFNKLSNTSAFFTEKRFIYEGENPNSQPEVEVAGTVSPNKKIDLTNYVDNLAKDTQDEGNRMLKNFSKRESQINSKERAKRFADATKEARHLAYTDRNVTAKVRKIAELMNLKSKDVYWSNRGSTWETVANLIFINPNAKILKLKTDDQFDKALIVAARAKKAQEALDKVKLAKEALSKAEDVTKKANTDENRRKEGELADALDAAVEQAIYATEALNRVKQLTRIATRDKLKSK